MISRCVLLLFWCLLLGACASVQTAMENPQTHQRQDCSAWGFGVIGVPIALLSHYECVRNLKKAGYVEMAEQK